MSKIYELQLEKEREELESAETEFLHNRQKAFEKNLGGTSSRNQSSDRALSQLDHNINPNPLD